MTACAGMAAAAGRKTCAVPQEWVAGIRIYAVAFYIAAACLGRILGWMTSSLCPVLLSRIKPVPAISRTTAIPEAAARIVGNVADVATRFPEESSSR